MRMVYQWKEGAHFSLDPELVGRRLERLQRKHGITAAVVVRDAEKPTSPLHDAFEWDDTVAAHQYRLEQARAMIRMLVVADTGTDTAPYRAYVVVREMKSGPTYMDTQVAFSDEEMRRQVLAEALKELRAFERKYRGLKELAQVFAEIDQVAILVEGVVV